MPRSAEETTSWVATKIANMSDVKDAAVMSANTLRITRKKHRTFFAGVISVSRVTAEIVENLVEADPRVEIVVNVPKESLWTGGAIAAANALKVAFGGMSDVMSAISREVEEVRDYVKREYQFVERGLQQHSRVRDLDREFDRVHVAHRFGLPPLRFIILNEYELTADHLRTAKDRYGSFDAVVITNPNGDATGDALQVAKGMNIGIFKWAEFLGRLNRR
jgi:hypothetical protein